MLEIAGITLPLEAGLPGSDGLVRQHIAHACGVKETDVRSFKLLKRSVDARKKHNVHFVITAYVECVDQQSEEKLLNQAPRGLIIKPHTPYRPLAIPPIKLNSIALRPVVIGAGPAGLFAALYLARAGLCPLVFERGADVGKRALIVDRLNKQGVLDDNTNIQFGEGGAGTFSDGKLTTNLKNPYCAHVLNLFKEAGAPEEILWQAKPHIGSDKLPQVVANLRSSIIDLGGQVFFEKRLTSIDCSQGKIKSIEVTDTHTGETILIETDHLILAIGHSARDTFDLLYESKIEIAQKPFSVGVRIEHLQSDVNHAQYGGSANHPALGAANYKFAVRTDEGRGVYTFCMCPGGEVVCAASEPKHLNINGMSRFARSQENANSALLVEVHPKDFGSDHPLAGVVFQRSIESAAYRLVHDQGGKPYQAPVQTIGDFLEGQVGAPSNLITPSYAPGVVWANLHDCLPSFITKSLIKALPLFERKLSCFSNPGAVLTGVETRSSSPIRICRNEEFQAFLKKDKDESYSENSDVNVSDKTSKSSGIYPCGEGSGYAGGIMSSAIDGIRVAESLTRHYNGQSSNTKA